MSGEWKGPARRSTETGVAEIIFADLGECRELLIEAVGLQHNSGTPDFLIQLAADNGAGTWDTTNYITVGNTGTSGFIFATSVPTTTSVDLTVELLHFNVATQTWATKLNGGRQGSVTGRRNESARNTQATAWNALRITTSTGTDFTANDGVSVRYR